MNKCETCKANKICDHNNYGFENCGNYISADVVEVVRCKDCVWWEAQMYGSTIGRCENPCNGLINEYSNDTDFCSYGERKE